MNHPDKNKDIIWIKSDRIPPGRWPFLLTARASLANMKDVTLQETVDLTEGLGGITITGQLEAYRQMILRRVIDLAQAMAVSWNSEQAVGALVCARALLETLATFHSLLNSAQTLADSSKWEQIGDLLDVYMFSTSKRKHQKKSASERPPRISQLVLQFIKDTQPGSEEFWEQICDMAHPNGLATFRHFLTADNTSVTLRSKSDSDPGIFVAIYNCAYSICSFSIAMTNFEILLEHIRYGEPPDKNHPLIIEKNQRDNLAEEIMKSLKET